MGNAFAIPDATLVQHLGWVLIHFLWQGLVVWALTATALRSLRQRSPNLRYAAAVTGLGLLAATPVATFALLKGAFDDPGPLITPPEWRDFSGLSLDPLRPPVSTTGRAAAWLLPGAAARRIVQPALPVVLILWLGGAILLMLRAVHGWLVLRRLLASAAGPLRPDWEQLRRVPARLGLRWSVRFLEVTWLDVPATVGWLRPVVLMPASALTGMRMADLEALVAHEIAHIRRYDFLINLLQTVVETLLFFHPAVVWISRRIRLEREACCDVIAAGACGDPIKYARTLTLLEELRDRHTLSLSLSASGATLAQRVTRLVFEPALPLTRSRQAAAIIPLLLAGLLVLGGWRGVPRGDVSARGVADVKPLAAGVYEILRVPQIGTSEVIGPVLARAIGRNATDEDLNAVVDGLLAGGQPQELAMLLAADQHVGDPSRYIRAHTSATGTYLDHRRVIERLRNRAATTARGAQPDSAAVRDARAAILLAAQQSSFLGAGPVAQLLDDPELVRAAALSDRQLVRLRRHIGDHRRLTELCGLQEVRAAKAILAARDDRAQVSVDAALDAMDVMSAMAVYRPDVQWKIAYLASRLYHFAPAAGERLRERGRMWVTRIGDPRFAQWYDEALTERPDDRPSRIPIHRHEISVIQSASPQPTTSAAGDAP